MKASDQEIGTNLNDTSCTVYSWGRGKDHLLGTGHTWMHSTPTAIMHVGLKVKSVACGARHSLLLTSHFKVFSWGEGMHGQLGLGVSSSSQACVQPTLVDTLDNLYVVQVSAGGNCSLAISRKGTMLAWGENSKEQLGLGASFTGRTKVFVPSSVSGWTIGAESQWKEPVIVRASIGGCHGACLDASGNLFTWGRNDCGQLGLGDQVDRSSPTLVKMHPLLRVSVGSSHTAVVDHRHQLWTWGSVGEGRLGHGLLFEEKKEVRGSVVDRSRRRVDFVLEPKLVEFFKQKRIPVADVACGSCFTIAVDRRGRLWSWGAGMYGQLGRGSDNLMSDFPERVPMALPDEPRDSFQHSNIEHRRSLRRNSASLSMDHSFSMKQLTGEGLAASPEEKKSFALRATSKKNVSDARELSADSPEGKRLSFEGEGMVDDRVSVVQLVVGRFHAYAVSKKGMLFFWGKGDFGLSGDGDTSCRYLPVAVSSIGEEACLVGTGDHFAIAVKYQGRKSLVAAGYRLVAIPNTEGVVHVLEEADQTPAKAPQHHEKADKTDEAGSERESRERLNDKVHTSSREWKNEYRSLVPGAEHFLGVEGWDLLDGPYLDTSVPHDPALELVTPGGIKSLWSQYKSAKKVEDTGRRELPGNRMDRRKSMEERRRSEFVLLPPKTLLTSRLVPTTLKDAMAVETLPLYEQEHSDLRRRERTRIISAHRRRAHSERPRTTFGTEMRFKHSEAEEAQDGQVTEVADDVGYIPAGIGLVLTANFRFDSTEKEIRVKEIVRGGAVDQSVAADKSVLGVDDVIVEVEGRPVSELFECRRWLMGRPGTPVSVTFLHKDKLGVSLPHRETFIRMYVDLPRAHEARREEEEDRLKRTPRFYHSHAPKDKVVLTQAEEQEIVQAARTLPRGSFSLRALQRRLEELRPGWKDKLSDMLVLVGVLRRKRLLPSVCASEADEADKDKENLEDLTPRPQTARSSSRAPTARKLKRSDTLESQDIAQRLELARLVRAGGAPRPSSSRHDDLAARKVLVDEGANPSPGPADYHVTYGSIGSEGRGFTFAGRAAEKATVTPGPADYQQMVGKEARGQGPTFQFKPRAALQKVQPPAPPVLAETLSSFGPPANPHWRSVHGGPPGYSISSRKLWETQKHLENGETYDAHSSKWMRDGAGPGQYELPASSGPSFSFSSTNRFAQQQGDEERQQFLLPGVCRDGKSAEVGGGLKFTIGARPARTEEESLPGPGSYELSSSYGGVDKGPSFAARYPSSSSSSAAAAALPGPGSYRPEDFDAIGSDLVAVGAASRLQETRGGKGGGEAPAPVNFSLANKLIDELGTRLKRIFKSPEEAFAYLDEKENQKVTIKAFRAQLEGIKIRLNDEEIQLVAAKLDRNRDGIISVEEFLTSFRWGTPSMQTPRERLHKLLEACRRRIEIVKQIKQRMVEQDFKSRRKLVLPAQNVLQRQDSKKKRKMNIFLRPAPPASARKDMKRGFSFSKQP